MSDAALETKTPKKRKTRVPLTYHLVEVLTDDKGAPTGAYRGVPVPQGIKTDARRDDYKRAVKKLLADGDQQAIQAYNGKLLTVISFPEPFRFCCAVQKREIVEVQVTEG